eukprot:11044451-Heterocapsa_arctica.AAC.1
MEVVHAAKQLIIGPDNTHVQLNFYINIILGTMHSTITMENSGIDIMKKQMISNLGIFVKSGTKVRVVSKHNDAK